jgi:hypothetical protein
MACVAARSKIERRTARMLSAIGAAVSHFSPNSPKLLDSFRRRFSRCFSIAGETPSAMLRLTSMHLLSRPGKREAVGSVFAEIDRLPASVQTVVHPK